MWKKYNSTFEKALKSFKSIQNYEREKSRRGVRVNVGKPIGTRKKTKHKSECEKGC